jgi:short-subunit dehydrogenase
MRNNLSGKVVVITGAASGIGEALASQYATYGAKLVLADVDGVRLARVATALRNQGISVFDFPCDVAKPQDWAALAQASFNAFGPAHVLINNAGVALADTVEHMTEEDAQWLMGINFWGVFHGCRAYMAQLRSSANASVGNTGVCIVNISSIFAMVSSPTQSLYNASKAAVRAFSDGLREELLPDPHSTTGAGNARPVQVLCVHPGGIQTRIAQSARVGDISAIATDHADMAKRFDEKARNTPAYAAQVIARAHLSGKTRVLIGADAHVADWLYRLWPAKASHWLTLLLKQLRASAKA